jgi:UDP-N-acetylmuramyl tripeptide synthase
MLLTQFLEQIPAARHLVGRLGVASPGLVRGLTPDSRRAAPEVVFAALPENHRSDPYQIHEAVARGTPAFICPPGAAEVPRATRIEVADPALAYAEAAAVLHDHPARRLELFQVGPAPDATAIAWYLSRLLEAPVKGCGLLSRLGCEIGLRRLPRTIDDLDALDVQSLLAAHVRDGGRACVVEATETTRRRRILGGCAQARLVEPGHSAPFKILNTHWRGSRLELAYSGRPLTTFTPVVGRRALASLGVALHAAMAAGHPLNRLAARLSDLPSAPGFLESVAVGQPFGVFLDAARTPAEIARTLSDARGITTGSLCVVVGAGGSTTRDERRQIAEAAAFADRIVFTADNPGPVPVAEILADMTTDSGAVIVERVPDRQRAIFSAIGAARAGDAVVLAGKGHRRVQELDGAVIPWDDRAHALAALAARGFVGDEL